MVDLILRNATVVDGTGRDRFLADVAVKNGRIAAVGDLKGHAAVQTIDADGLILTPGFIDAHAHSDFALPHNPTTHSQLAQGVTTEIMCNCGISPYPVCDPTLPAPPPPSIQFNAKEDFWKDYKEYFSILKKQGIGVNTYQMVGHNCLRIAFMGYEQRPCTDSELRAMQEYLHELMQFGVRGFSTGLTYEPGCHAAPEEIKALAAVVGSYGGMYTTHMSNYSGSGIEVAMDFAVETAWEAGTSLQFSHVAPHGEGLWGKGKWLADKIAGYRKRGVDVCADTGEYPTIGVWWAPRAIFPRDIYNWQEPWETAVVKIQNAIRDESANRRIREHVLKALSSEHDSFNAQFFLIQNWESIIIYEVKPGGSYVPFVGKSVAEIAKTLGKEPIDVYFDMLLSDGAYLSSVNILEKAEDRAEFLKSPYVMFGSDIISTSLDEPFTCFAKMQVHPRVFGHAIYALETVVGKEHLLTLEQAVHKMTGLCAYHFRLHDRGLIRPGYKADLTLFDPNDLHERGSFLHPTAGYPSGIKNVWVNGVESYNERGFTGNLGGTVLLD